MRRSGSRLLPSPGISLFSYQKTLTSLQSAVGSPSTESLLGGAQGRTGDLEVPELHSMNSEQSRKVD